MKALELQAEVLKEQKGKAGGALAYSIFDDDGNLQTMIAAANFDLSNATMLKVTITAFDKSGNPTFYLYTPVFKYDPQTKNWRLVGGGNLTSADGGITVHLKEDAWPQQAMGKELNIDIKNLIAQDIRLLDAFSLVDTYREIQRSKTDPQVTPKQLRNLEYGFWNKFALPLAALVYGLLGAPLGIRNVRTGAATGFAVSIVIIFGYIMLANLMNVYAMGGVIPPYVASFTPLLIGLIAAGVIIWRRNG